MVRKLWGWLDYDTGYGPVWWFVVIGIMAALAALGTGGDVLPYWVPDVFDLLPE